MVEHTPASGDARTQQPDVNGRRAFITGGTTGIGRAIAEQMLLHEDIAVAAHFMPAQPRRSLPDACRAAFAAHMIGDSGVSLACRSA